MRRFCGWFLGLGLATTAGLLAAGDVVVPEVAVFVAKGSPLAKMELKDLKAIYTGEKRFQAGIKLQPLMSADEVVSDVFLVKALKLTRSDYKKLWMIKAFKEGVTAPEMTKSGEETISLVKASPGAIGIASAKDLDGVNGLKVLFDLN